MTKTPRPWQNSVVRPGVPLREALQCLDKGALQIVLVVSEGGKLEGVLTDGNFRRALLRGDDLAAPVETAMTRQPVVAREESDRHERLALLRTAGVHHLPIINKTGLLCDLVTIDELTGLSEKPNWVILMAGGLGERLHPLTRERPKPLLEVDGKPILEIIVEGFAEQGFKNIFLSVNYKAEMIRSHFGDGSRWGVEIRYLHEEKRLGTGGALSLLPQNPDAPFIVMNGDLLTKVTFDEMLRFHAEHEATATMAVRDYCYQIPYGVVDLQDSYIRAVEEKPEHRAFVNAGIYVLSPEVLAHIPANEYFDMTTLIGRLVQNTMKAAAFPLREYWIDVGRLEEFQRAQEEWTQI